MLAGFDNVRPRRIIVNEWSLSTWKRGHFILKILDLPARYSRKVQELGGFTCFEVGDLRLPLLSLLPFTIAKDICSGPPMNFDHSWMDQFIHESSPNLSRLVHLWISILINGWASPLVNRTFIHGWTSPFMNGPKRLIFWIRKQLLRIVLKRPWIRAN